MASGAGLRTSSSAAAVVLAAAARALRTLADGWERHLAAAGKPDREAAGRKALTTFCHALMNSAGFLYVD